MEPDEIINILHWLVNQRCLDCESRDIFGSYYPDGDSWLHVEVECRDCGQCMIIVRDTMGFKLGY